LLEIIKAQALWLGLLEPAPALNQNLFIALKRVLIVKSLPGGYLESAQNVL
jgi:hypothetical protein